MTRPTTSAVVAAVALLSCVGLVAVLAGRPDATAADTGTAVATARVERGDLSRTIAANGTLTFRARADGSPYEALNHATGTYTRLPEAGDVVACGESLYRVDDRPVLLLCGRIPLYRDLAVGATGPDAAQLNRNLHRLRYDDAAGVRIRPTDRSFTWRTRSALIRLQRERGQVETGRLTMADAVVLPSAIRVSSVPAQLGGSAQAGTAVVRATTDTPAVQVSLDPALRGEVPTGSAVLLVLPGNASTTGTVADVGRVASVPDGAQGAVEDVRILLTVALDEPDLADGLDQATVRAQVVTDGVKDALSVPVVAVVGRTGGGYAVDVVHADGRRELVAVTLGLFDDAGGRVQVEGDLEPGDAVVVPS